MNDITNTFSALGLSEPLCRALADSGYVTPTPIQTQAIPKVLTGRDLLGLAQTGTGKTAAFALPLLDLLAANPKRPTARSMRALILAPTRELVVQIAESIGKYSQHTRTRHTTIFGGVGQGPQVKAMSQGMDIVVATPGRLLDLVEQRLVRLDSIEFLILDEADRMFDMGFIRDVRRIVKLAPKEGRQSLLFSATMPKEIEHLAMEVLRDPDRVAVTPQVVTVERIDQRLYFVPTAAKRSLLADLLADAAYSRVIVFTRTKHGANRVAEQLEKGGVVASAIHGNKSQGARQRALQGFRDGEVRVLVATDLAARGIDVPEVSHVINYDLPVEPESYVHRIGRTARAGAEGIAISFCDGSERSALKAIERLTKRPLTVVGNVEASPEDRARHEHSDVRAPRGGRPQQNRSGKPSSHGKPSGHGQSRPSHQPAPGGPAALAAAVAGRERPVTAPSARCAAAATARRAPPADRSSPGSLIPA
ncbi:DEAD/DEAH box helicase [Methylobrevis pamukkalensis]|uniref:DEAD-box ATP-dependent RNA helicase RhpA n=1 Tax=Methylobrevis pamukkalensis TaxID=1439726 RepID=A0A1E3H4T3_9HYPH|nr:DEAD/DEAH box helicase [Methylobrevis pamukkalensis]ODN70786.1 ATP-dependent RNA helicase RhlE [Methylobrevis pamukkalensis]